MPLSGSIAALNGKTNPMPVVPADGWPGGSAGTLVQFVDGAPEHAAEFFEPRASALLLLRVNNPASCRQLQQGKSTAF